MDLCDSTLPNDSKTRNFVNQIDKALKGFEYSSVWADLISNLGKLMKVLNSYSSFQFLPKKVLIAKRLAQCLHPALPSGVHLKTLECYKLIFSMIPREKLAADMSLFGNGLLSLFNNSAMSVKPKLFEIIEEFLLPMKELLKPLLPGIIQGFLPCLEDGSEFYDRGTRILNDLSKSIGKDVFFKTLWQVIILNPSIRIYGIAFILNNFNKKMPLSEQLFILGNDSEVLTTGLCCLLEDSVVLVQRNTLDFLLNSLPLYKFEEEQVDVDKTKVILSSLTVLLQRDAYLNRRLISWYFGTHVVASSDSFRREFQDKEIENESDYFAKYTKNCLVTALHKIIDDPNILYCQTSISCGKIPNNSSNSSSGTRKLDSSGKEKIVFSRLFRLFSALLDNPEIGPSISRAILFEMLDYCFAEYHRIKEIDKLPKVINQLALVHLPKNSRIKGLHASMEATLRNYQNIKINVKNESDTRHFEKLLESQKTSKNSESIKNSILLEFTKTMNDFFSRLETEFLWSNLGSHLNEILNSTEFNETEILDKIHNWSLKITFLIKTLPIEGNSDVCSRHLPQILLILNRAIEFILQGAENTSNSNHIKCAKGLVNIYKIIINLVLKVNICICDLEAAGHGNDESTINPRKSTGSMNLSGISSERLSLKLFAEMLIGLRKIFVIFINKILGVNLEEIEKRMLAIQRMQKAFSSSCIFTIQKVIDECQLQYFFDESIDTVCYHNEWTCLLTDIIRLIISFTEIPLILEKSSQFDRKQLFDNYGEDFIFFNDFKYSHWIVYFIVLSIFTQKKANIKFIIANGLMDLLHGSLSVHGWQAVCMSDDEVDACEPIELFMMMPVLGRKTLRDLLLNSNFISFMLISLWDHFTSSKTSPEDSVSFMFRMFDLIALTKKSPTPQSHTRSLSSQVNIFEDFFIDKLLSSDISVKRKAFTTFMTIWELSCPVKNSRSRTTHLAESWQYDIINMTKPGASPTKNVNKLTFTLNLIQKSTLILLDSIELEPSCMPYRNEPLSSTGLVMINSQDSGLSSPSSSYTSLFTSTNLKYPISLLSREWLEKSCDDDQIIRILIPILSVILAPSTSRLSIWHANEERYISANRKSGNSQLGHSTSKRTSMNDCSTVNSQASPVHEIDDVKYIDENEQELFGISTNADGDLVYLRRGDPTIDNVSPNSSEVIGHNLNPDDENTAINQLYSRINAYNKNNQSEHDNIEKMAQIHIEELMVTGENGKEFQFLTKFLSGEIFPLHKFMLLYTQNVDLNQMLYAVKRIKVILTCIGPKFLIALANQKLTDEKVTSMYLQKKIFFNMSLIELLTRHFRSLYGVNFYDSLENTHGLKRLLIQNHCHNLLDFLMLQLTWILASYCPILLDKDVDSERIVKISTQNHFDEASLNELASANFELKLATLDLLKDLLANVQRVVGDFIMDQGTSQLLNLVIPEFSKGLLLKQPALAYEISLSILRSSILPVLLHSLATSTNLAQLPMSGRIDSLFSQDRIKNLPVSLKIELANLILERSEAIQQHTNDNTHVDFIQQKIHQEQSLILILCQMEPSIMWIVNNRACNIVSGNYIKSKHKVEINLGPLCWWPEHSLNEERAVRDLVKALPTCLKKFDGFVKLYLTEFRQTNHDWISNQPILFNILQSALHIPKCTSIIDEQSKLNDMLTYRLDIQTSWFQFLKRLISSTNSINMPAYLDMLTQKCCQAINSLIYTPIMVERNLQAKLDQSMSEYLIPVPNDYLTTVIDVLTWVYHSFLLSNEQSNMVVSQLAKTIHLEMDRKNWPRLQQQEALMLETSIPQSWEFYSNVHVNSSTSNMDEIFKTKKRQQSPASTSSNLASSLSGSLVNWIMIGRCMLIQNLPKILQSIAMIWDTMNFHTALVESFEMDKDGTVDHVDTRVWLFYLKYFAAFGKAQIVRKMIRDFLEPISSSHSSSFLIAISLAWPDTLLVHPFKGDGKPEEPIPLPSVHLLSLLEPTLPESRHLRKLDYEEFYASNVYLNGLQCSLLSLLVGRISVTTANPTSQKNNLANLNYDPLIGPSEIVLAMKEILKDTKFSYPTVNMVTSFPTCLGMTSNLDFDIGDYTIRVQPGKIQINILHLLYAWISLSNENLNSIGLSSTVLLTFLKDITSIEVNSAIQVTSQVNLANHSDEIINISDDVEEATTKNLETGLVMKRGTSITSKDLPNPSSGYNQTVLMPNNLPPIANFILLKIFNELLVNVSLVDEKREQKEYQDICLKLLESIAQIASSAMEQPTWFRRTYQVRQVLAAPTTMCNQSNSSLSNSFDSVMISDVGHSSYLDHFKSNSPGDLTIQSFHLLTKHLIILFDVVYKSEEKDKISSILINNIFPLIFPYLRVRYVSNLSHFDCASQLIASLSSYQFTRRAWRKEIFEIFMEGQFFQMLPKTLFSWMTIIDNLMTQDKNTIKEALARLTFSQAGALNLFSNKEAEDESKASVLKKLSFIIFSSDPDQYTRSMNDLLERLTDCIRSLNGSFIEPIHTQIFLFARVIMLRIPASNLYSLWHLILPELFYIFNEFILVLRTIIKSKNGKLSFDNLSSKLLNSVLAASKVLATALLLGEENAPQFSYNRWVFLSQSVWKTINIECKPGMNLDENSSNEASFKPLIEEISKLLKQYCEMEFKSRHSKDPDPIAPYEACLSVLTIKTIDSARSLLLFFTSLSENKAFVATTDRRNAKFETCIVESSLEASVFLEYPESVSQNQ